MESILTATQWGEELSPREPLRNGKKREKLLVEDILFSECNLAELFCMIQVVVKAGYSNRWQDHNSACPSTTQRFASSTAYTSRTLDDRGFTNGSCKSDAQLRRRNRKPCPRVVSLSNLQATFPHPSRCSPPCPGVRTEADRGSLSGPDRHWIEWWWCLRPVLLRYLTARRGIQSGKRLQSLAPEFCLRRGRLRESLAFTKAAAAAGPKATVLSLVPRAPTAGPCWSVCLLCSSMTSRGIDCHLGMPNRDGVVVRLEPSSAICPRNLVWVPRMEATVAGRGPAGRWEPRLESLLWGGVCQREATGVGLGVSLFVPFVQRAIVLAPPPPLPLFLCPNPTESARKEPAEGVRFDERYGL
ncbi:hypothetical protein G7046_g6086 [Stylonectria norvegica]|nr:hypothetical protein G7046_g6086 [Stylonectria norvegica]